MRISFIFLLYLLINFSLNSCKGKAQTEHISQPITHTNEKGIENVSDDVAEISNEEELVTVSNQKKSPIENSSNNADEILQVEAPKSSVPKNSPKEHIAPTPPNPSTETETKVIKSKESAETLTETSPEASPEIVEEELVEPAFSHDGWDKLLKKYVSASGKVNYKGFKSEMGAFQAYLDFLSQNPPQADWNRNKIRAYWINAYNAYTVKIILDNYPLKSITDLGKPWDKAFIKIGGKAYTLNDIEHKILRAKYFDSRIHFAVNCASFSCPKLLNKAFTEANVSANMASLASLYINDPKHNSISPEKAELSQLFEWYKDDFTKKGSLIDYINKYSKTKLNPDAEISYKAYNWSLNE